MRQVGSGRNTLHGINRRRRLTGNDLREILIWRRGGCCGWHGRACLRLGREDATAIPIATNEGDMTASASRLTCTILNTRLAQGWLEHQHVDLEDVAKTKSLE